MSLLNVYIEQNPRRHVILKETSQMRTICTQIGTNLSACLFSIHQILSWGWYIFVDLYGQMYTYVHRTVCAITAKFIITNLYVLRLIYM
jgi:hypothetical protein